MTDRTRLLIINSPSNPTGKVYSEEEYRELAEVLIEHPKVMIVCDDIYEHIYWGEKPFRTLLNVCPELAGRTVIINGVSKAYAMTGWRIGYAAGPQEMVYRDAQGPGSEHLRRLLDFPGRRNRSA